jgi:hypothetical protein
MGFAGEIAASTLLGVSADWEIYPEYQGDGGFDFTSDGERVEVKTTGTMQQPQLSVPVNQLDSADQFVLAVSRDPTRLVYVIGYISRPDLKTYGRRFDDHVAVDLKRLEPFEPREIFPEEVREIQDPQGDLGLFSG